MKLAIKLLDAAAGFFVALAILVVAIGLFR